MSTSPDNWFKSICFLRTGGPGDAGVFDRALRLCQTTGAELTIVSVVDDPPEALVRFLAAWGAPAEAVTGVMDESIDIERLAETARERGVNTSCQLLRGRRFLEVSRKVLRDKHDLLIKAAEPTHAIQRVLLGHTDRQLIRKCPCQVWIEKPSNGKTHDRILAAVDPAPFQDDPDVNLVREALNTTILEYGQLLARIEGAELQVFHAWSFDVEMALRSRAGLADEAIVEVGESFRQRHESSLAQLVGPYMGRISRVHLVKGNAGEEIVRLAASELIDVIVMGTLCRSGLGGVLIGNTAETVLDHATCSVVALKPPGFVSPVRL